MRIRLSLRTLSCPALSLLLAGVCLGQSTERVSLNPIWGQANQASLAPSVSANGRFVAFQSSATNLVPGAGGSASIFVHDRVTGDLDLVSVSSSGVPLDNCTGTSISNTGRFVVFLSFSKVYVHDRFTGSTNQADVDSFGIPGNGGSFAPTISTNGRFVVFHSIANNLVPGDTNGSFDVFVHNRQSGVTDRISVDSSGAQGFSSSDGSSISANGRFVAFQSVASNLVPGDTNGHSDIFVHNRQTGETECVSVDALGAHGNEDSKAPAISGDGRYVAFHSAATNFVSESTNGVTHIFLHDRQSGVTSRVSMNSMGTRANRSSFLPTLSASGRHVAFQSHATNLVPEDTNGALDTFIHSHLTGVTERASVSSFGTQGSGESHTPSLSSTGRRVAFASDSVDLVPNDTNGNQDIFLYDRWDGLGVNSIYLTGPSSSPVLTPVKLTWQATRGGSQYWLFFSQNHGGSIMGGHRFDIGNLQHGGVFATGTIQPNGIGTITVPQASSFAAGHTIYFELAAQDGDGTLYDSNLHAVTFQ